MALTKAEHKVALAARAAQASANALRDRSERGAAAVNEHPTAPKALVSWAHRGESWSDDKTAEWTTQVVEFTGAIRASGIDADLDLFHSHEVDIDWTRFGPAAVGKADFVIVAISEAWAQRWSGTNSPAVGAGAVAEADALRGLFQKDQSAWQRKVVVVILPSQTESAIPDDLMRATRFWVDPDSPDSLETLIRTLTGQPEYTKPALGQIPVLPPAVAESLGVQARSQKTTANEFEDYSAVLKEVRRTSKRDKGTDRVSMLMGLLDALSS